ncbi:MAG: hypothetical protein JWN03_2505 [Nocardia sp.]|uniref:hypothetical protein n=1 Tax=Nocardia sp. TaxID=1821 RepID=UPI00260CA197|nr:hypothetical protein [Nocardia sp.]MCU1642230.1 hypothetical protein [Nocardia sp.]
MASGATGSNQTGWPGLLNSAQHGNLKLLNVDSKALQDLNKQCEDLVAIVLGLINVIKGLEWTQYISSGGDGYWTYNNHGVTTHLSSMRMLFQKIRDNSTLDLVGVLQKHQTIVTDMAHTFINADKQYSTAEGQSAVTFSTPGAKDLGGPTGPMSQSRPISGGEWMKGTFSGGGGSGVGFDSRAKDAIGPTIESGSFFQLKDFANISAMFDRADGHIWDLAGTWHQIGQTWGEAVETFRTNNQAIFKNENWQGAGAESAVKFLNNYITAGTDLQKAMLAVATVLADTGDFNLYCWGHLPRYDQMHFDSNDNVKDVNHFAADKDLAAARTWWDGHESGGAKGYVDGIALLAGMIPAFTDPNITGSSGSGGTGGNGGGGTGGNGDDGNGSGGGGDGSTGGGGSSDGGGKGSGGGESGGGSGGGGDGSGSGSGSGGSGGGSGGGHGGSGSGDGGASGGTGHPGQGSGPTGPNGTGSNGASGGLSGSDLLSLFSEVLQLISSGIPTLVQLGNQLIAQLGPGLQALAKAVEDGSKTVKQAMDDAAEHIAEELQEIEDEFAPPGATGPVELSFALFPGGGTPEQPLPEIRAGIRRSETFEDFTNTRVGTEPVGETSTGNPGLTVEGEQ